MKTVTMTTLPDEWNGERCPCCEREMIAGDDVSSCRSWYYCTEQCALTMEREAHCDAAMMADYDPQV